MAVTVTRTSSLFTDLDGDGVADPGETLLVHILIQNTNATDIVNLKVYDTQSGLEITDLGTVKITPIAFDDYAGSPLTIVGNTPYIVTASALLGNDIDPDGLEASLTISGFTNLNHVTVTDLGGGNFQIVPETGYQGVASFEYSVTDEDGLASVSTGKVNIQISGQIWYVDNGYAGANGASDGSYLKPFTSLGQLNDDGTGAAGTVGPNDNAKGDDDVDGAGDSIFVYNRGTTYTGGITLEAGQKLYGDGHEMTVNGFAVGAPGQTANSAINYSNYGVTLSTDNTVAGLNLNGTANTAVGIRDGNTSVTTSGGTLNVSGVAISGAGQAIDIDQGGNLNVALTSLSTTGTADGMQGVHIAGLAATGTSLISGTFTAGGGSIAGASHHSFQIGGAGPSSGGTVAVTYGGTIGGSATGSAVNIADRLAGSGDITLSGNISHTSAALNATAGIALSNIADGNISFTGTKTIAATGGTRSAIEVSGLSGDSTINFSGGAIDIDFAAGTTGHAFSIAGQSGTSSINVSTAVDIDMVGSASGRGINIGTSTAGSVNFTGGNLTISTRDGAALFDSNSAGSTHELDISGSGNTLSTTNGGQLVEISNATTTGITFETLTTGATVANTAVRINNLDGGSFNTGTITVTGTAGVGSDGVRIEGGSSAVFNLGTVGASNTSDDGVEINGAGNGAVTIDSISVQNNLGQGVEINGATSAVTISAGSIGGTNDPAAQGVLITGGNGNVTVGATVSKTTAGNVVEVTGHTGGAVSFSNTISATGGFDNGIELTNNSGGSIAFGGNVTLTTGGSDALSFTNNAATGAAVSFTGGNLAITTTGAGRGINATSTTIGGSLTVTGANNTISTANGAALTVDDVRIGSSGLAFKSVNVTDATGYGIFLDNTGTTAGTHGGLTITGDAGASKTAGGIISAADNAGIAISNARDIILDQMTVQNGLDDGVRLSNVANFSLTQSNVTNNGNALNEHGVDATNVTGTVRFTDVTFSNNEHEQVHYTNDALAASSADIEFNNVDFTSTGVAAAPNGSHGINLTADGASSMDVRVVNGSDFNNLFSNSFQAQNEGTGTLEVTIANATFTNVGASAINIAQNDSGTVRFNIYDNGTAANPTFLKGTNNAVSHSININQAGGTPAGAVLEGRVHNNYIGTNAAVDSASAGGAGIRLFSVGSGTTNIVISNNTIRGTQEGIRVQMSEDTNPAHTVNATIFNNNVTVGASANGFEGISIVAGAQAGDVGILRLNMYDNTAGSASTAGNTDFMVRQRFGTTIELLNIGGSNNSNATVQNYLDNTRNNNPNGPNGDWFITQDTALGGGFDSTSNVPVPTLPSPLLLNPNPGFAEPKDSPVVAETPVTDPAAGTGGQPGGTVAPAGSSGSGTSGPAGSTGGASGPPAGNPAAPPPVVVDDGRVTQAELDLLVAAAIDRWAAAGATAEQVATMKAVRVTLTDMMGVQIGGAAPGTISIDEDGAGHGWFVDATPGDDSEFAGSGTRLRATAEGGASGHVDLLTVLMHELGHQIGLDDSYLTSEGQGLMYGYVDIGERRLPAAGEAAEADGHAPAHEAYLLSPLADVGTLPAGKSVRIEYQATIDPFFNAVIVPLSNTATAKGDNIADTNSNTNVTAIDTLTLGDRVFVDANSNNLFDSGEGRNGVALTLFADSDNNGVLDIGTDVQLATTTTAGAGAAAGSYVFANLAPGNYIVRVDASNFNVGGALAGTRGVVGGVDPDGDAINGFNVDNDHNGVAGPGGSVVAGAISLAYDTEPTSDGGAIPKNDINNTLDFGFVENAPPVANDDPGLTATEDQASQYSTQLTGNDTDADSDPITIVGAGNATNGSVSVAGGVVTFTPTANFSGVATFEYTISDGQGHTDVGLATVTVSGINDAPVNTVGATVATTEDSVNVALSGISISDPDANPATDKIYVTFQVTKGSIAIRTDVAGGIVDGDIQGQAVDTITLFATLNKINATLAASNGLTYTPTANFNGSATLLVETNDGGLNGADPGLSGDSNSEQDSDSRTITVSSVNDAPVVIGDGTEQAATIVEDTPGPGETVNSLFAGQYSDAADNQTPGGSSPGAFSGVAVVANGSSAATGQWQYYNTSTSAWVDIGSRSPSSALLIANTTLIRFNPALDFTGAAPTLTVHLIDNSLGFGILFGQVVDISGPGATGGTTSYSTGTVVLSQTVTAANAAPAVDLDGDGAGTGFASAYSEGGAAAAISDTDVSITDSDPGDDIVSATITITNAEAGDKLNVGTLPASVSVDGTSTDTMVKLVAVPGTSAADFEAAIEAVTYSNTGDNPTDGGTNTARTITVTVNDGAADSAPATATVTVADDNSDAPSGTNATITAIEDMFRPIQAADLGFGDVDGSFASVTITAVTGGKIYVDADGSAGANPPVEATLPATFTAQDLIDGKASFKADSNLNGSGAATITFAVTDDDGNVDGSPNVLTVDVTAQNDSPIVPDSPDLNLNEGSTAAVTPGLTVSDVDLDARNGGAGDYGGAQFVMNRDGGGSPQDQFFLTNSSAVGFTVTGSILGGGDLQSGGQTFGNWFWDSATGVLTINFTSSQTPATTSLVNAVLQAIQYNVVSNTPPATVDLVYTLNDGSPGGGQGGGAAPATDSGSIRVNITATNDGPWLDLLTPGAGTDVTVNYTENDPATILAPSASVMDPDLTDFDGGKLTVSLAPTGVTAEDRLSIAHQGMGAGQIGTSGANLYYGGTLIGTFAGGTDGSTPLVVTFNASADQAAVTAAVRRIAYANVSDKPTTADRVIGFDLTDGDGGQSNLATATVHVAAAADAPVAQPDSVSTLENAVGTGSLFDNNGSGPDTDADGDQITVSEVNGSAGDVGVEITLASGAKLTVNQDGTYSYNPNGKFNRLTDNTSGAVNTSQVGDTFSYTVTGGNTVSVTVTVNGVAGPGDWLMGNAGDNTITGTPQPDTFVVSQGGNDTVTGLASDDVFYFGGAMTAADNVNGGTGFDTVVLQGDYSGGLTLDGSVTDIESISMLAGTNVTFGDPGTNLYDYDLTTHDDNFAAGIQVKVNASILLAGEDLTFDGSAETDAKFLILGGRGQDDLTGGAGNDTFFFAEDGRFAAGDVVDGGDGYDGFFLRGNYTVDFTQAGYAGAFQNIENMTVSSASDIRYARSGGSEFDYSITWDDDLLASGGTITINGALLTSEESLAFNGSDESNGTFKILGGGGNDVLTGGAGADLIFGGLRGDTLTGGAGNDVFRYDTVAESNSTERDGIQDFNSGDLIDLSRIDADVLTEGNQAFTFIGSAAFSGKAGELRFENISLGGPVWEVEADTNGDGVSDFEVVLVISPPDPITSSDFIL